MSFRWTRILLCAPLLATLGACDPAPVEELATRQQAIGPQPVDTYGQTLDPKTLEPVDRYPLGQCGYVCLANLRWATLTNGCRNGGACRDRSGEACTQSSLPLTGVQVDYVGCYDPRVQQILDKLAAEATPPAQPSP